MTGPKTDDICYATTNRQQAVKELARECDLILVIGSTNSSNSVRLVEVAREHGVASHLIDFHHQVQEEWLDGVETVGITSGASAPEDLVEDLVEFFRERGAESVSELKTVEEDVRFMLPTKIRRELAERDRAAAPSCRSSARSPGATRRVGRVYRREAGSRSGSGSSRCGVLLRSMRSAGLSPFALPVAVGRGEDGALGHRGGFLELAGRLAHVALADPLGQEVAADHEGEGRRLGAERLPGREDRRARCPSTAATRCRSG